jgi:hypothetical protein
MDTQDVVLSALLVWVIVDNLKAIRRQAPPEQQQRFFTGPNDYAELRAAARPAPPRGQYQAARRMQAQTNWLTTAATRPAVVPVNAVVRNELI